MSSANVDRAQLVADLSHAERQHSTAAVLWHSALAARFGLSATDWKCAEIVHRLGPLTAGRLAELSGLTTGAITGVVDRLEQGRIVRRGQDPNDRRRVIIHPVQEREEEARELFASFEESLSELYDRYSDEEITLILDYVKRATAMMGQEASRMREQTA